MVRSHEFIIETKEKGLYPITETIFKWVSENPVQVGLVHLFVKHTSASLLIQENADPSARQDLESFLDRLVPDGEPWHTHTAEGPDDTSAHMKSSITSTSLTIPVADSRLDLGTWQGLYLWEHRQSGHRRKIRVTLMGEG